MTEESAAKKRAAARREAILNSKGNRLAKLTSSARGEEAAALYDDPPVPSVRASPGAADLLGGGETSQMPRTNISRSSSHSPGPASRNAPPNSAAEQQQQQQQMLEALMRNLSGGPGPMGSLNSFAPGLTPPGINTPTGTAAADPFSAMMAQIMGQASSSGAGDIGQVPTVPTFPGMPQQVMAVARKKTRLEKVWPLLHMVMILCLLAFFVVSYEPALFGEGHLVRWASLARSKADVTEGVHPVPIFYAFATLEVILHSVRTFVVSPPSPPSGLIGMVIANLPPPIPNAIAAGSKYLAIGGAILDDLSVLLFGVGVVVWYAGWAMR